MSEQTEKWWSETTGEKLSHKERVARLQHFFSENGQRLYHPDLQEEKNITLVETPFTIPTSYATLLPDIALVPLWAGKEISWSIKE